MVKRSTSCSSRSSGTKGSFSTSSRFSRSLRFRDLFPVLGGSVRSMPPFMNRGSGPVNLRFLVTNSVLGLVLDVVLYLVQYCIHRRRPRGKPRGTGRAERPGCMSPVASRNGVERSRQQQLESEMEMDSKDWVIWTAALRDSEHS